MARRKSFDDGHGMDHHKLHNMLRVAGGAAIGAAGERPEGGGCLGSRQLPRSSDHSTRHSTITLSGHW